VTENLLLKTIWLRINSLILNDLQIKKDKLINS